MYFLQRTFKNFALFKAYLNIHCVTDGKKLLTFSLIYQSLLDISSLCFCYSSFFRQFSIFHGFFQFLVSSFPVFFNDLFREFIGISSIRAIVSTCSSSLFCHFPFVDLMSLWYVQHLRVYAMAMPQCLHICWWSLHCLNRHGSHTRIHALNSPAVRDQNTVLHPTK